MGFFFHQIAFFFLMIHENTKINLCELIDHHPKEIVSSHDPKKWKKCIQITKIRAIKIKEKRKKEEREEGNKRGRGEPRGVAYL